MTTTAGRLPDIVEGLRRRPVRAKVGVVVGGLGAYWPQFPAQLPQLQRCASRVVERLRAMDADVVDAGFVSDPHDGARAAEQLRVARCDLIVMYVPTYLTSSMVAPVAQRSGAPSSSSTCNRRRRWTTPPSTPVPGWPTAGRAHCRRSPTCSNGSASSSVR